MKKEVVQQFFEGYTDEKVVQIFELQKSGSERINYYIATSPGKEYIVTYNRNTRENEAFFYFSNVFSELNLNTPNILKTNPERTLYLQNFLGKDTLSDIVEKQGESEQVKILVKKSIEKLFELQNKTKEKINYKNCFEYETYNEIPITHDLYYFKNYLVDVLEIHYHKFSLLKEFKQLALEIESLIPKGLMLRDFQSRNIVVNENEVCFIDYQSAMKGPFMYDVVSFLYQAKANFSESFKEEMLDFYFSLWKDKEIQKELKNALPYCQLMRFLQVLGAYGFRGIIQRKLHFLNSLEKGISNLANLSSDWGKMREFPHLQLVIEELSSEPTAQKIQKFINK